ncbi:FAD:protein FMN transferase [Granulosicoccus sp. 3-233]|uniref:FAD:protein FMN transferase n=1 Tax=Granulosicoccus sp. 3-233 TaxID=3417969 RepID=UPI003D329212
MKDTLRLEQRGPIWVGEFRAMASPCEVHLELRSKKLARQLVTQAQNEALRVERLFSRYRSDNVVHRINTAGGKPVTVDEETARMLDFADTCFHASNGLFDVTSGVLREAWTFDGSDNVPSAAQIEPLLARIGWQRVSWNRPHFSMPAGMQIDLGGIGKEYAVDRVLLMLRERCPGACLVNFGGDLHASKPPQATGAWSVGIESRQGEDDASASLQLQRGALTTSGDARRYLLKEGVRYSHVLDPMTGWPVVGAPAAVTVAGNTCIEAGIMSTLALLHGADAEAFLERHKAHFWVQR